MSKKIEKAILRQELSSRGGGVEISLKPWGFKEGSKMSAYQNYLGGGMLGAIQSNHNIFRTSFTLEETKKLARIELALKKYFHALTNHSDDEWESATFEENQRRSVSAY